MPDRVENLLDSRLPSGTDSVGDKLQRESELLRDGLSRGALGRLQEMYENPGSTALSLGGCAVIGGGLNLATRAGGRWAAAAKIATIGFGAALGVDVLRRGIPTIGAMGDTWSSGANLELNKQTVANLAGTALVDYPLMFASGYAGFKLAGRVPGSFLTRTEAPSMVAKDAQTNNPQAPAVVEQQAFRSPGNNPSAPKLADLLGPDGAIPPGGFTEQMAQIAKARPKHLPDGLSCTVEQLLKPPDFLPGSGKGVAHFPDRAPVVQVVPKVVETGAALPEGLPSAPARGGNWARFSAERQALLDACPEPSAPTEVVTPAQQLTSPGSLRVLQTESTAVLRDASVPTPSSGNPLANPRFRFLPATVPVDFLSSSLGQPGLQFSHLTAGGSVADRVRPVLKTTDNQPTDSAPKQTEPRLSAADAKALEDEFRRKLSDALKK